MVSLGIVLAPAPSPVRVPEPFDRHDPRPSIEENQRHWNAGSSTFTETPRQV